MKEPPFFAARIASASGSKPGAMTPSATSRLITSAVDTSTTSDSAMKSPNEHIGSALRARTYASASGLSAAAAWTAGLSAEPTS